MRVAMLVLFVAGVSGCANQGDVVDGELPPASSDGKADGPDTFSGKRRLYKLDGVQAWLGNPWETSRISMSEVSTSTGLGLQAEGKAYGFSAAHPTPTIDISAQAPNVNNHPTYFVGVIGFHRPHLSSTPWQPVNCQFGGKTYNVADGIRIHTQSNMMEIQPAGYYEEDWASFGTQSCGISTAEDEDFAFMPYVYDDRTKDIGGEYTYDFIAACDNNVSGDCPSSSGDF